MKVTFRLNLRYVVAYPRIGLPVIVRWLYPRFDAVAATNAKTDAGRYGQEGLQSFSRDRHPRVSSQRHVLYGDTIQEHASVYVWDERRDLPQNAVPKSTSKSDTAHKVSESKKIEALKSWRR